MQSLLGTVNLYRRFIKDMATVAKPLTKLTNNVDFDRTSRREDAFLAIKEIVLRALALRAFDPKLPVVLSTEASGWAVGAFLGQDDGMGRRPVAYFP